MKKSLLFIFLMVWCASHYSLLGQSPTERDCMEILPVESVKMITDRAYYLAGETIWFKAYVFVDGHLSSEWSKVLYVDVFNYKKDVILQQKFRISAGMVNGSLDLPEDVNSGNYFVRAYTQYMRNFSVTDYFSDVISIVNPKTEISYVGKSTVPPGTMEKYTEFQKQCIQIPISLSEIKYEPRERIDLKIGSNVDAELTVSVRKKGTDYRDEELAVFNAINPWLMEKSTEPGNHWKKDSGIDNLEWLPEIRGLTLSGKIQDKDSGQPAANVYCLSSVIGDGPQIHMDKTGEKGDFVFVYHNLHQNTDMSVSVRNINPENLEVLINSDFSSDFPDILPMPFDTSKHRLFEEMYVNQQITQSFSSNKIISNDSRKPVIFSISNLGKPDIQMKLEDFIALPNLVEVFRELVPAVSVKGSAGNHHLEVFDPKFKVVYDDPLVLLDQVPVSDLDALLLLDPTLLKGIDVFYSKYQLGDFAFNGIVSIQSKTDNFAGYKWTDNSVFLNFKTYQIKEPFQCPVYNSEQLVNQRTPDFRTLLYWNPSFNPSEGEENLSFYSSDHYSRYEVIVSGYTEDGLKCEGRTEFEVVRN